jgi:hypothetical protein
VLEWRDRLAGRIGKGLLDEDFVRHVCGWRLGVEVGLMVLVKKRGQRRFCFNNTNLGSWILNARDKTTFRYMTYRRKGRAIVIGLDSSVRCKCKLTADDLVC